ncbi:hypothetical protein N5A93_02555 [Roseovarius sp. EGI FJ00037]|uniref:hypothetical protein n=1 Tax=Roseovarius salincola TaxID=2978479 RepID=UPI0022A77A61|nr:hypothetical protein [Roseovarius sp. EGI FJ00037]MCZ0811102.1 hypothetical protein [Roseovarius sp. EGI FJ00037]
MLRKILYYTFAVVFSIVVTPVAGDFFVELARSRGFYDDPEATMSGVQEFMQIVNNTWWYPYIMGCVIGVGIGFVAHRMASTVDRRRNPPLTESALTLQYRRDLVPHEANNKNIFRWFSMKLVGRDNNGVENVHSTQIFVTFDKPSHTSYVRPSCSDQNTRLEVKDLTCKSAIIVAHGDLADTTVDLIFSERP